MFGDSGYAGGVYLEVPCNSSQLNAMQSAYNKSMYTVWIAVDWSLMEVKLYFTSTDFNHKFCVNNLSVGKFYLLSTILTNFITSETASTLTKSLSSWTVRICYSESTLSVGMSDQEAECFKKNVFN